MPLCLCFFIIYLWDRHGQVIKQGTLLHVAAFCGAVECIKFLLDRKADVDKRDEVVLSFILMFFYMLSNSTLYGLHQWIRGRC